MQSKSDAHLLRDYAEHGAEAAFSELVARHTNLVYSAAARQMDSVDMATEITQRVFIGLARGAGELSQRLAKDASLAGWLCRSARNISLNVRRDEFRRHSRERQAMEHLNLTSETAPDWERLRPILDEVMFELSEADYDAVVMRFFNNQDLRSVGQMLGVSEDTAQKRVSRALEKLREHLSRRGIGATAAWLSVALSNNAVQAAPAGLAVTISSAAALAGTSVAATTIAITGKALVMTTLQKTLVTVTIAAAVGTGIYEAHSSSEELKPLRGQIESLGRDHNESNKRLAALLAENELLKRNNSELPRLRAELALLQTNQTVERTPIQSKAHDLASIVQQIKERLEKLSELNIPELEFLQDRDWLDVAKDADMSTDKGLRDALSRLRRTAKEKFARLSSSALRAYARANNNQSPTEIFDLRSYFAVNQWSYKSAAILEGEFGGKMLERYQVLQSGEFKWDQPAIGEKAPVDKDNDIVFQIGAAGYWYNRLPGGESGRETWSTNDITAPQPWVEQIENPPSMEKLPDVSQEEKLLEPVFKEFEKALNGKTPKDPSEIIPYLKTDLEKLAFEKLMKVSEIESQQMKVYEAQIADHNRWVRALSNFRNANQLNYPKTPADLAPYLTTQEDKAALERMLKKWSDN